LGTKKGAVPQALLLFVTLILRYHIITWFFPGQSNRRFPQRRSQLIFQSWCL